MTITKTVLKRLQNAYRKEFPKELVHYLVVTYGEEPFPYEYSEQDLYANIQRDIDGYYAGKLDITVKSLYKHFHEECHHWMDAYMTEIQVNEELRAYIMELENLLLKQGIITDRMKTRFEEDSLLL